MLPASRLFSYVVDHDHGLAPNPADGLCTLVHCKFGGKHGRRNVVEIAKVGDWILGTGGRSKYTSGQGTILYLMRVDEKLPFDAYLANPRFTGRLDCIDQGEGNLFALVSHKFFYFGRNALLITALPLYLKPEFIPKRGPGFRSDYPPMLLPRLVAWFARYFRPGLYGLPCAPKYSNVYEVPIPMPFKKTCRPQSARNKSSISAHSRLSH